MAPKNSLSRNVSMPINGEFYLVKLKLQDAEFIQTCYVFGMTQTFSVSTFSLHKHHKQLMLILVYWDVTFYADK